MAQQTGKNIVVAYKVEATLNAAPGATDAKELRLTPSPGLTLRKDAIRSNEIRSDGLTSIARHGSRMVEGSYSGELSVGSYDDIFEAIARSTLVAASTVAEATLTTISFGTNTVDTTGSTGFIAAGLRVGDVFRVSGTGGANDDLNAQVRAISTNTLTVQDGAFTAIATAVTTFALTRGTKLTNGTTPTRRSFYIDEYNVDIDLSEAFGGCRWTGFTLNGSPNGMADLQLNVMGMSATALATGASPYYTTPTRETSRPLVFADAKIGLAGSDITIATAFSMAYQNTAQTLPVIGNSVTPDVFDNEARLTGSLSVLRKDLAYLTNFADEDELELTILLQEPVSAPKGYIGIYIPKLKLMGLDAPLGSDGAMTESLTWEAGARESAVGYDATLFSLTTSA